MPLSGVSFDHSTETITCVSASAVPMISAGSRDFRWRLRAKSTNTGNVFVSPDSGLSTSNPYHIITPGGAVSIELPVTVLLANTEKYLDAAQWYVRATKTNSTLYLIREF